MYQVLLEKFADNLLPIVCGAAVWFGVHYFVIAPRILKVELPETYREYTSHLPTLPNVVYECLREKVAPKTLSIGSLEAALYTSSLRHISQPIETKTRLAIDTLDHDCGVTAAIEAEQERARLDEEARLQAQKEKLIALKEEKRLEAERLLKKAEEEAQRRKLEMVGSVFQYLIEGKR